MSLRVTGYHPDGSRIVVDDGPARARCVGNGGLPLSQALTSVTSWKRPERTRLPRQPLHREPPKLRARPVCGYLMPLAKEYCGRMPGHTHSHRSARIMAEDSERRRTHRPWLRTEAAPEKCPQCALITNAPNLRRHLQGAAHR